MNPLTDEPPSFCDHEHGYREYQCTQCRTWIIDGGCTAYCGTCPCCEPSDLCHSCRRSCGVHLRNPKAGQP